jgi:hypothetical protein
MQYILGIVRNSEVQSIGKIVSSFFDVKAGGTYSNHCDLKGEATNLFLHCYSTPCSMNVMRNLTDKTG